MQLLIYVNRYTLAEVYNREDKYYQSYRWINLIGSIIPTLLRVPTENSYIQNILRISIMHLPYIVLLITVVSAKVYIIGTDIVLDSGQVTPRGYDWPLCKNITSYVIFGSTEVDAMLYTNSIVLDIAAGIGYVDSLPQRYRDYAAGMITMSGTQDHYPGSTVGKMWNNDTFGFTHNESWPWVDITIADFRVLFDYYNKTTLIGGIPTIVTITCEKDDNQWKLMPLFPTHMIMKVGNGLFCIFAATWIAYMFYLIKKHGLVKESTDRLIVLISLFIAQPLRLIGFIDFGAYSQVYPYIVANVLTSSGVPFVFLAAWVMILVIWNSLEDDGLAITPTAHKHRYRVAFITIGIFLVALELVCAPLVGLPYVNNPYAPLHISYGWVATTAAFSGALAIFHLVTSGRTIHYLRTSGRIFGSTSSRKMFMKRTIQSCIVFGICFVGYSINAGITFLIIGSPFSLTITWLFYTTDLSVITYFICRTCYVSLRRRVYGTPKTTENSKNSKEMGSKDIDGITKSTDTDTPGRNTDVDYTINITHNINDVTRDDDSYPLSTPYNVQTTAIETSTTESIV